MSASRDTPNPAQVLEISPRADGWDAFCAITCEYFAENWPAVKARSETGSPPFGAELVERYKEGRRGYLMLMFDGKPIGFANVYVQADAGKTVAYVAEFYIKAKHRRLGCGTKLFNAICQWGRIHSASEVRAEVDPSIPANRFWSTLGMSMRAESRNVYSIMVEGARNEDGGR
ncbi:MAG TPA: GNAT family N-acetyltransferase [Opitutaceae bacterium]|jgi:predicted acetyltransferase